MMRLAYIWIFLCIFVLSVTGSIKNFNKASCEGAVTSGSWGFDVMRINYEEGAKIGELIYLYDVEDRYRHVRSAMFRCSCGNKFETVISRAKTGHTKSCGCRRVENSRRMLTQHGLSGHPLHKLWMGIKSRCYNPNVNTYKYYGAKGIRMHEEWVDNPQLFFDYAESLQDFGVEGYSIDRIDNGGNYEPGNLRWTDNHIQATNKGIMSNNTSGYTGVRYEDHAKKWSSRIRINKKQYNLGYFGSMMDAIDARNNFIIDNNFTEYKIQHYG